MDERDAYKLAIFRQEGWEIADDGNPYRPEEVPEHADSRVSCSYCGRRIGLNRPVFRRRRYFADGSDFLGHKSCYREMTNPEDPRCGHERHDIH